MCWGCSVLLLLEFDGACVSGGGFLTLSLRDNGRGCLEGQNERWRKRHEVSINTKERTDFLSFFGGCGDLGPETLGVGSVGGSVGFGVGSLGCLVVAGVTFC